MSTQTSRFLRALRAANPALIPARLRLASLRAAYKAGNYSGHPEEMLDQIECAEVMIGRRVEGRPKLQATPAPVVQTDTEPRSRTAAEQREYEELTARCHKNGGPFEPGLDAAERRLAYMQDLYRHGGFMGHPEDLLEDIETEQRHIKRLTAEKLTEAF
jgi:tRNA-dihydrouridine synthase